MIDAGLPKAPDPPAFGCIVYVRRTDAGVVARVANLEGLQVEASDERAALSKLVPLFRERVGQFMQRGEEVPWIVPPLEKAEDELRRFLPVHL